MLNSIKGFKRAKSVCGGLYGMSTVGNFNKRQAAFFEDISSLDVGYIKKNETILLKSQFKLYKLHKKGEVIIKKNTYFSYKKKKISFYYKKKKIDFVNSSKVNNSVLFVKKK